MANAFSGIELGKRSIMAHSQQIQTAGHNISNADTEGYTRQRVQVKTFDPLYRPDLSRAETPGQIGQGTTIESVSRLRDELLDSRIVSLDKALENVNPGEFSQKVFALENRSFYKPKK